MVVDLLMLTMQLNKLLLLISGEIYNPFGSTYAKYFTDFLWSFSLDTENFSVPGGNT
jgi:hypothetical protein